MATGRRDEEADCQTRRRIVEVARAILHRSNSDVSMRQLAREAGVSTKTTYKLFGSKNGVLREMLRDDVVRARREARAHLSDDPLQYVFDVIQLAALATFRSPDIMRTISASLFADDVSLQTAVDDPGSEFWGEVIAPMFAAGLLHDGLDPEIFSRHLLSIYISAIRVNFSMPLTAASFEAYIGYGFSLALAARAKEDARERLLKKALGYEVTLRSLRAVQGLADVETSR